MKRPREELNKHFEEVLTRYVSDYDVQQEIVETCYKKFNVPFFRTQTILKFDAAVEELKDVEIFWVLYAIKANNKYAKVGITDFFTEIEIKNYTNIKYKSNKVAFPIVIPMIQIRENQWIGKIKASELVKWRGSILKYNKNIQRRLSTIVRGDVTYETITLNNTAVEQIAKLFKEKKFIPNVITLNIDDASDFYYDEEKMVFVINEIDRLDITDGYHRLVALSKVIEEDPNFDYTMELRITCFSDDLANHFIWQEEQRTAIPKRTVKSYNMEDVSNKITKRINESSSCNLSGSISRGGMVDFSSFADIIDVAFVSKMPEKDRKLALASAPKDMIETINAITENEPELMTNKLSQLQVKALAYTCVKYYGKDKTDPYATYKKLVDYKYEDTDKVSISSSRDKNNLKIFEKVLLLS